MIELIAVALLALSLYALRGWFIAARTTDAARAALEYAHDLQHDVVELFEASHDMSREPRDEADAESQADRLNTAVAEFHETRQRRMAEYIKRLTSEEAS